MATQDVRQETELAQARAFLAEHGIAPDADGAYLEDAVLAVIRARGWEARLEGTPGDWTAEVGEDSAPLDFHLMVAGDADRQTAILGALDAALTWVDRGAARLAFDREARERLGMSGEEFLRRWNNDEFDGETVDYRWSDIARLLILAPGGR